MMLRQTAAKLGQALPACVRLPAVWSRGFADGIAVNDDYPATRPPSGDYAGPRPQAGVEAGEENLKFFKDGAKAAAHDLKEKAKKAVGLDNEESRLSAKEQTMRPAGAMEHGHAVDDPAKHYQDLGNEAHERWREAHGPGATIADVYQNAPLVGHSISEKASHKAERRKRGDDSNDV